MVAAQFNTASRKRYMRRVLIAFFLIALISGVGWWLTRPPIPDKAAAVQAQRLTTPYYSEAAEVSLTLFAQKTKELGLPSASLAVSVDGELVWAAALGTAHYAESRAAGLDTLYRAGSITKTMTGIAAARLVQAGKLSLDAPIQTYVPHFPEKRWNLTARHLGSHTGGIRHYAQPGEAGFWVEQFTGRHFASLEESLDLFRDAPLLFEPGMGFEYSTHGFTVLGTALEAASGMAFPELMAELVWQPAGMDDTRLEDARERYSSRAAPYIRVFNRLVHYEGPNPSYKWPGAGALTTPTDLVRMGSAFLSTGFLNTELKRELFAPVPLADGSPNPEGYALGWRNQRVAEPLTSGEAIAVLHHGGTAPGGSSFLLIIPSDGVAVAAMTNVLLDDAEAFRQAVYEVAGIFLAARRM
jgi:serine beta-lactamase-like protein LACTB